MTKSSGSRPIGDRRARISDVAAAAGVSTATVSRALTYPERLRPDTREHVLQAIRALGYTPHEAARSLRAGESRMVLVVIAYLYSGAFFSRVINGIESELSASGYTVITGSLDGEEGKARRLVDLVYARQIDGVIVLTGHVPVFDGRSILEAGVPVVAVCAKLDHPGLPSVLINDEECAKIQTQHLIDLGHRRLIYVSGVEGHYNEVKRYAGYLKSAKAAGLKGSDSLRLAGNYSFESGADAARAFLQLKDRPTGVVCCSDELAIGFMKTVTGAGLRCPADVSIVGFDGIEFADYCEPTLTTIRQPRELLGAEGARILLQELNAVESRKSSSRVLRGELLIRASSGPPPRLRRKQVLRVAAAAR